MASIKLRQTGIPTPGRSSLGGSAIPTPGTGTRSRSSSQGGTYLPTSSSTGVDEEYMNLAFKNAVKANDPASHRVSSSNSTNGSSFGQSRSQGSGLNQSMGRAKTPTFTRPASRQSDVGLGARSVSRAGWVPEVGDAVRIESLGFEGILHYVGEIDGKAGLWAGVELSGGFAGKGKNDGSVAGKQYFTCPPKCGVFVATTKLSPPTVSHPGARPSSVASSRGGRTTPSFTTSTSTTGRITPSSFSMTRGLSGRISYGSGRTTPSTSGRITPSTSTSGVGGSPETPAVRAARMRAISKGGNNNNSTSTTTTRGLHKSTTTPLIKSKSTNTGNQVPVPVPGVPTPGSRASKYAGMTAKQLSLNKSLSSPISPVTSSIPSPKSSLSPLTAFNTNIPSDGVSPTRIRTISSVKTTVSGPGSPFSTPKPRLGLGGTFTAPSSGMGMGIGIGSPASGNTPKARIPSGLAMPPPPIPIPRLGAASPMRSVSSGSTASLDSPSTSPTRRAARVTDAGLLSSDELEARGKALQERIAGLTGGKVTPLPSPESSEPPPPPPPPVSPVRRGTIVSNGRARSRSRTRTPAPGSPIRRPLSRTAGYTSRPSSVASTRPGSVASNANALGRSGRGSVDSSAQLEQMQSRIDALEYENSRLRGKAESGGGGDSSTLTDEPIISVAVELEKKVEELSGKVEGLENEKSKMAGDLKRSEERRAELEVAYDRHESDKTRFILERGELEAAKTRLEELNDMLQSDKSRLDDEKASLEQEKASAEERIREVESAKVEVEQRLKKATVEFEEERRDLRESVDELRQAGQETIALYEEKLRQSDLQKYELEDRIVELEAQALSKSTNAKMNGKSNGDFDSHHRSPSGASTNTVVSNVGTKSTLEDPTAVAQTTSQIETETLQLQLSHLQNKIASLEDLLDDIRSTHDGEVSAFTARLEKAREREEGLRKEVGELKRGLGEAQREKERGVREGERRVMEVEEALRESTANIEEMRAEVEGLRGELGNVNGLAASTSSVTGELQNKLTEAQIRAEQEKEEFLDEIQRLTEKMADWEERCEKLKRLTEDQSIDLVELEGLRKKANRDVAINGTTVQSPSTPSKQEKYDKHELNTAKEEIMGLKHIIQELQKEILAENQRNKVLESENQLLMSEMEQLRQEVKILEDNLDQSILREEENLSIDGAGDGPSDVEALKKTLKEQRLRADVEIEQLRKKLADIEMKNARTNHDLNKEISELESLVEAKIYREDELEQEVERLKERLVKHDRKKSSKSSTGPDAVVDQSKDVFRPTSSPNTSVSSQKKVAVCEICDKPGHDIFNCDLLKGDGPLSAKSITDAAHKAINGDQEELDLWCEDCEGHGHSAVNCPNSEDVF